MVLHRSTISCRNFQNCNFCLFFFLSSYVLVFLLSFHGGEAYKNYTVGGTLGWYDNHMVPKANYQKWANGKNFSLGDFLIFNTDTNHTVIQTYNATTYKLCDFDDANNNDTTEWSSGTQQAAASSDLVAVPLLKEGPTYFFSGDYSGEQCKKGQHFKITVTHGKGLPPGLKPDTGAPGPNAADYANSTPDTVVPSNFDDPKGTGDDDGGGVKATSKVPGRVPASWGLVIVVLSLVLFG